MSETGREKSRRRRIPWWGKALLIFGGVLCLLAAAWTGWLLHAQAQLRAEIDAIRARGEPLRLIDLKPPPLPPEKDAAVLLRQAVQQFEADVEPLLDALDGNMQADGYEDYYWDDLTNYPEVRRAYSHQLQAILTAAGPTIGLARKARGLGCSDLGIDYSGSLDEAISTIVFSRQRAMARFLCLAAIAAHDRGDDEEAIECTQDILTLSDWAGQYPLLIGELVALAIEGLAEGGVERIAPGLRLGGEEPGAAREQVQELIALLLDEKRTKDRLVRALLGKRVFGYETCEAIRRGRYPETFGNLVIDKGALRAIFKPVLIADEARLIRSYGPLVEAARQDDYPSAKSRFSAVTIPDAKYPELTQPFTYTLFPDISRAHMIHFRAVASCRMAATALAMRLYEIDHGRRPEKLAELVPHYLPAVPKDPFDPSGGPIRLGRWAGRELLYSLDINGTDEGGQDRPDPNDPSARGYEDYDWVFFLNGDRPREPLRKIDPNAPTPGPGGALPPLPGLPRAPNTP